MSQLTKNVDYQAYFCDQLENIAKIPGFDLLFATCYAEHFSITMASRLHDYDKKLSDQKALLYPLNRASIMLAKFCDQCISELEPKYMGSEIIAQLKKTALEWREHREMGNVFLTYRYAKQMVDGIVSLGYPFVKELKQTQIAEAFCNISFRAKSHFRFNLYVSYDEAHQFLSDFIQYFLEDKGLYQYVDKVELAQKNSPVSNDKDNRFFPTCKVYLSSVVVNTHHNPLIFEFKKVICDLVPSKSAARGLLPVKFNEKVSDSVTLCQGYNNYKSYLDLLGLLDLVYNRSSNYAFLNKIN